MLIAITGTPGTGKSCVSTILRKLGYEVIDLNKISTEKFVISIDRKRNSKIIDTNKLNRYVKENYAKKDTIFVEGHLSHLLKSVDKVIILRCHPNELKKRLTTKGWKTEKISENVEAEILDIILCETIDLHPIKNVFEIDTTGKSIDDVSSSIKDMVKNKFKQMKKYNIGYIDWSEEALKDF